MQRFMTALLAILFATHAEVGLYRATDIIVGYLAAGTRNRYHAVLILAPKMLARKIDHSRPHFESAYAFGFIYCFLDRFRH